MPLHMRDKAGSFKIITLSKSYDKQDDHIKALSKGYQNNMEDIHKEPQLKMALG